MPESPARPAMVARTRPLPSSAESSRASLASSKSRSGAGPGARRVAHAASERPSRSSWAAIGSPSSSATCSSRSECVSKNGTPSDRDASRGRDPPSPPERRRGDPSCRRRPRASARRLHGGAQRCDCCRRTTRPRSCWSGRARARRVASVGGERVDEAGLLLGAGVRHLHSVPGAQARRERAMAGSGRRIG